jgi:hypothetical protein
MELRHYQEANTKLLFHVGVIILSLCVNDEQIEVDEGADDNVYT